MDARLRETSALIRVRRARAGDGAAIGRRAGLRAQNRYSGHFKRGPMTYTKRIVCLANSRKPPSGRCIAGIEVQPSGFGRWVRPVSERSTREISEEDRRYSDGAMPAVLDIIDIAMKQPQPHLYQQENHLIDDGYHWSRVKAASWSSIQPAVETFAGPLWLNGFSSSYGINDYVPEALAANLARSLYLIRPTALRIVVAVEGGGQYPAKRKARARFRFSGAEYCFVLTDPLMEQRYLAMGDGETRIDEALVCVSLGEFFNGNAYKLAAAIITP